MRAPADWQAALRHMNPSKATPVVSISIEWNKTAIRRVSLEGDVRVSKIILPRSPEDAGSAYVVLACSNTSNHSCSCQCALQPCQSKSLWHSFYTTNSNLHIQQNPGRTEGPSGYKHAIQFAFTVQVGGCPDRRVCRR